jgi:hypothetical protein
MQKALGTAIAVASGSGFPLSQVLIARLGRPGAVAVAVVTAGILARDVSLVVNERPAGETAGSTALLYVETAVAVVATVAGLASITDAGLEAARSRERRVGGVELLRRTSLGLLFGIHAMRFKEYLQLPGGRRAGQDASTL